MSNIIEKLEDQYKDNSYMLKRLHFHLTKILPKTLNNELQTWKKRKERNKYLLEEQQIFIQVFLSKNDFTVTVFALNDKSLTYVISGCSVA